MFESSKKVIFDVSYATFLKAIVIILLLLFLYLVRDLLLMIIVAIVIASAIDSWVDWLQKRRIPRPVGILTIYVSIFLVLGVVISLLIPPITEQINDLSNKAPEIFDSVISGFEFFKNILAEVGMLDNIKDAFYDINVKYGKFGEEKSSSQNPFKPPMLLMKPGSCFVTDKLNDFYGRVLTKFNDYNPNAVHNGIAFTLAANLK